MDIEKFIEKRPYLYHLTSNSNAKLIIAEKRLYSANELIKMSKDKQHLPVQRKKRTNHYPLFINGNTYSLRDQKPISEKALTKCLTDGWEVGDFLYHLNERVFMWPTLDRLWRHFNRYKEEKPIIFQFPTKDILNLNPHFLFCRLNSGATRANSYLGGKPPTRGKQTFLPADQFLYAVREVAEVTFPGNCDINVDFAYSSLPDGKYKKGD
ncbi:DUF7002 family protein [Parafilimonas sp.]|uniref:DUF7002 family protein n=1 Tax=Parafilimonas sp. TaxID=1969739 RepID=UPI0039E5CAD1